MNAAALSLSLCFPYLCTAATPLTRARTQSIIPRALKPTTPCRCCGRHFHNCPCQIISRYFMLLHHLLVKLILTRETRQKGWELEPFLGDTFVFYNETLLARHVAFEIPTHDLSRPGGNPGANAWFL